MSKYSELEKMQAINEIEKYMLDKNIPPILNYYVNIIGASKKLKFNHNIDGISIIPCRFFDFESVVRCSSLKKAKKFLNNKKYDYETEEEVVYYYLKKSNLKIFLFRRFTKAWIDTLNELEESQAINAELNDVYEVGMYNHSIESDAEMDEEVRILNSAHAKNLI
jgi:hypothetical protein